MNQQTESYSELIPVKRWKTVLIIILCAFLALVCVWGVYSGEMGKDLPEDRYVGMFGVAFFSLGIIIGLIYFFKKNLGLTINEDGIIDNTTIGKPKRIYWQNIKGISLEKRMNQSTYVFELIDQDSYLNSLNIFGKMIATLYTKQMGSPAVLNTQNLAIEEASLNKKLLEAWKQYGNATEEDIIF